MTSSVASTCDRRIARTRSAMRSAETGGPSLGVPCATLLAAEIALMTVSTLLLFGIGILNAGDTDDPCSSDGCRQALVELEAAAAPEGRDYGGPCDDFYEYVCGSWNGSRDVVTDAVHKASRAALRELVLAHQDREATAAQDDNKQNSAAAIHADASQSASALKLRAFYSSCLAENRPSNVATRVNFTTRHFNASWDVLFAVAENQQAMLEFMVMMALRHSGEQPINPDDENLVRVENLASLNALSQQLSGAKRKVRALFLYLRLLARVGQVQALANEPDKEKREQAFAEFCRNVTHETGVSAALELLLVKRAGMMKPNDHFEPVLGALAAVDQALLARIESSWLHWDLVARAEARLGLELEAIRWRDTAEGGGVWRNYEQMADGFLPEMGADFFANLYAVLEKSHRTPFWARCFKYKAGLIHIASDPRMTCFSPLAVMEPVFYEGAEPFVNYATLGTLHAMGKSVLGEGVRRQKSDDYQRNKACLQREHGVLNRDAAYDSHNVLLAALAVRAALEAVEASSRPLRSRFERQMFFRRVCFLTCSRTPNLAPVAGELPPRLRCNLAVRHTRLFHAAFQCDPQRRLARAEVCQLV